MTAVPADVSRSRTTAAADRGFTLIELLVVIVILGLLAAIATPVYLNQRDKAAAGATRANLRSVVPDVILTREHFQKPLVQITHNCSNCACRGLANPLPVADPGFLATTCGANWLRVAEKLAEGSGEPVESVKAMLTDGWGYPIVPDENEGEFATGWGACGTASDVFVSGGKDHIIAGPAPDDIRLGVTPGGFCFG